MAFDIVSSEEFNRIKNAMSTGNSTPQTGQYPNAPANTGPSTSPFDNNFGQSPNNFADMRDKYESETGATGPMHPFAQSFVAPGLADTEANLHSKYMETVKPSVPEQPNIIDEYESIYAEAKQKVDAFEQGVVADVLAAGKYGTDTEAPTFRAEVRRRIDEEYAKGGEYADAYDGMNQAKVEKERFQLKEAYKESEQNYNDAVVSEDTHKLAVNELEKDLAEMESTHHARLQSMFNRYLTYLEENDPELYKRYATGTKNEFSGDIEVPSANVLSKDRTFLNWYENGGSKPEPTLNDALYDITSKLNPYFSNASPHTQGAKNVFMERQ